MTATRTLQTISRSTALTLIAGLGLSVQAGAQEFSYNGDTGPGFWWELSPDWAACEGIGKEARQSPINISVVRVDQTLGALDLEIYPTTIDIFNNGHTIEQHYDDTGSSITFEGSYYELSQFHFHTLSEHSVGNEQGVMELHAVFQEPDGGDYLVVGVLLQIGRSENAFIQSLINAGLPEKDGDTTESDEPIDLSDGLTNTRLYYTYPGSLTTPPCSETVTWVVLSQPARMTRDQLESFRRILGNNFRPTQALNGRVPRASALVSRSVKD